MTDTEPPFSDAEKRALRNVLKRDERWTWLAQGMRNIAVWFVAIAGGALLAGELVVKLIKRAIEP